MKEKDNLKTLRGIREINKSTDNAPKKIVKAISDNLYQRLLNNNLKVDNLEKSNSAVNILEELSKDDKEKEKEKRLMIKLPFLSNIKSRYKDYNEANLRKVINRSLNRITIVGRPNRGGDTKIGNLKSTVGHIEKIVRF